MLTFLSFTSCRCNIQNFIPNTNLLFFFFQHFIITAPRITSLATAYKQEHETYFPKPHVSQRFKTFTSDTSFFMQVIFPRTNSKKWQNSSQPHLQNIALHNITYKTSCYQLSSTVYPLLLGKPV